MSTAELKSYLHKLTVETNEDSILQQVVDYFSSLKNNQEGDWWNTISENERKSIQLGLDDFKSGKSVPHEVVMKNAQNRIDQFRNVND